MHKPAKSRAEFKEHLDGKRLTNKKRIYAKCYDCMGGYADGKNDCEVPKCSLYPLMPYRKIDSKVVVEVYRPLPATEGGS